MKNLVKAAAVVASLAPVGLGLVYTSGESIGDGGSDQGGALAAEIDGFHTVSQYELDGWSISIQNVEGVVSETVTDPDGNAATMADLPADIAEEVEYPPTPEEAVANGDIEEGDEDGEELQFPAEDEALLDQLAACVGAGLGLDDEALDTLMTTIEEGTASADEVAAVDAAVAGCSDIVDALGADARAMVDDFLAGDGVNEDYGVDDDVDVESED